MKKLNKIKLCICVFLSAVILTFSFASCTSEIDIQLKADNTIDVKFSGEAGIAFEQLIRSSTGVTDGNIVFDTENISYELSKNGFTNVSAVSKHGTDLTVTMSDKNQTSPLFKSKIINTENNKLTASLTPKKLIDFYNSSDDQIVMFLDMMLSPLFNDEVMSESEYIETMASFYGDKAAKEISDSSFKISLINPDGKKAVYNIPMAHLLTLNEVIELKD